MRLRAQLIQLALLFSIAFPTWADEAATNDKRAWVNYVLRCQGCHLPDAMGMKGKVPRMNGFVGYFLHSDDGRRFIVQVPGVATASLPDNELSELMNWVMHEFSREQMPGDFAPFTAEEVAHLRKHPETDPLKRRGEILVELAKTVPALSCYSDAWTTVDQC